MWCRRTRGFEGPAARRRQLDECGRMRRCLTGSAGTGNVSGVAAETIPPGALRATRREVDPSIRDLERIPTHRPLVDLPFRGFAFKITRRRRRPPRSVTLGDPQPVHAADNVMRHRFGPCDSRRRGQELLAVLGLPQREAIRRRGRLDQARAGRGGRQGVGEQQGHVGGRNGERPNGGLLRPCRCAAHRTRTAEPVGKPAGGLADVRCQGEGGRKPHSADQGRPCPRLPRPSRLPRTLPRNSVLG